MEWDEDARRTLAMLMQMVPETYRSMAEAPAREESEIVANEHGAAVVSRADVVRGWIRTTPPDQRDGLVAIIEHLGLEPLDFSDDLQSDEGWSAEPEAPDM